MHPSDCRMKYEAVYYQNLLKGGRKLVSVGVFKTPDEAHSASLKAYENIADEWMRAYENIELVRSRHASSFSTASSFPTWMPVVVLPEPIEVFSVPEPVLILPEFIEVVNADAATTEATVGPAPTVFLPECIAAADIDAAPIRVPTVTAGVASITNTAEATVMSGDQRLGSTPKAVVASLRDARLLAAQHALPHAGFRPPPGTWNLEPRRNLYAS